MRAEGLEKILPAPRVEALKKQSGEHRFVTVLLNDPGLIAELDASKVRYAGVLESKWFGPLLSWVAPTLMFVGIWFFVMKRMGGGMHGGMLEIGKSKARVFMQKETGVTFKDVAGIDEAKEELMEVVEFLKNPDRYKRLGGKIPKGVLIVGAPGTGKTLLAKAVAGEAGVPFLSLSGSEFVEMFVGVGAARVRDLFEQAAAKAPCIVFIDELDALGKARGARWGAATTSASRRSTSCWSKWTASIPTAASSSWRPPIGRRSSTRRCCARVASTAMSRSTGPTSRDAARSSKCTSRTSSWPPRSTWPRSRRARRVSPAPTSPTWSTRRRCARRSTTRPAVDMSDFEEALDRIVAGLEKKNRVMNPMERRFVAYHEAGHALVAELRENADRVSKISIIPRGIAALGYTQQPPTEDRYLMRKSELLDRLDVLLAGRVAEQLVFDDVSTGAENDLQRATDMARHMVTHYGMSDALGLATYDTRRAPLYLNVPTLPEPRNCSEHTAEAIDGEVRRLLDEARERVSETLSAHRATLDLLAVLLLEKEVVDRRMLDDLLRSRRRPRSCGAAVPVRPGMGAFSSRAALFCALWPWAASPRPSPCRVVPSCPRAARCSTRSRSRCGAARCRASTR